MEMQSLADVLARNTKEGELYIKLEGDKVRCFACGHRCPIPEGKAGICRVRFNKGGKLYAPSGYVGALQDDPIEKKPFFHALPGARAMSFGMLGCDFHCAYCFLPSTRIATSKGMLPIGEIVSKKITAEVFTHTGEKRAIQSFFERPCHGPMLRIKPAFLPSMECTPEHPLFARLRPDRYPNSRPEYVEASKLTKEHCLVVPKRYEFSQEVILNSEDILSPSASRDKIRRKIKRGTLEEVLNLSRQGKPSSEIALSLGKSASHIRRLQSKLQSGGWNLDGLDWKQARLVEEGERIRFPKEHGPGIPKRIQLDEALAELLGFYCAEGSVCHSRGRVHPASINFTFSKKETEKAERVKFLLKKVFGVRAYFIERETSLAVASGKTSVALFFKILCGNRGSCKKIPEALFAVKRNVAQSFLNAYAAGDGYRAPDGQIRISARSEELAWGVAWLVQKLGFLPQFYRYPSFPRRQLLGRRIKRSPWIYLIRWYERPLKQRHVWQDENSRYVLVERIEHFEYEGPVYNLEVEEDNTYLANFAVAHNCQNWVTSQALRDPVAGVPPEKVTPQELIRLAFDRNCEVIAGTYNEPLITSEWAVEIFKEAKQRGLVTAYISNGNGTPEVLDYIRPWVDLYKVDLKSFDDRHYRELGGTLENVCETIRGLYQRGFWLELLTLLIPGFNSSDEEIKKLTEFIAAISPDIPWHVTAFHKDYKMTAPDNTSASDLIRAAEIGKAAGLRYIYAGNLPGMVGTWENTYCPNCGEILIERCGFQIRKDRLSPAGGQCVKCKASIPGFWKKADYKRSSSGLVQPLL